MPIGPTTPHSPTITPTFTTHSTAASLPAGPAAAAQLPNNTPGHATRPNAGRASFQQNLRAGSGWVDTFRSSKENIEAFKKELNKSERPLVHFPHSARGDMNAYKYTAFLDQKDRPLTVFEYSDNPPPGSEQEAFNRNIDVIKQHISSLNGKLEEGRDYIFGLQKDINNYKKNPEGEQRVKKHYQEYDNIMSNPEVREKVHAMFKSEIAKDPVKTYLANKSLSADVSEKNRKPESKLIVININKRAPQKKWDPREYRHTTPDDAHMQSLIDGIYDAQDAIEGTDKLDISIVGSKFNELEQQNWEKYGEGKGVKVHFFNDMQKEGLDRNQQRAALFALTDRYKSTTYLGHQSGVNEDAQILSRTNVHSLSEYLSLGQIGISRVEARPQLDAVRTSGVDMATGANSKGNFYSLRNSEFLTTEGILAAVQIKLDDKSNAHRPLNELLRDLPNKYTTDTGKELSEMTDADATDKLFEMILENAGKMKDGIISADISEEAKTNYKSAIGVIVRRMEPGEPGLSPEAKQYFTNTMKQELARHDSKDPVTRHYDKLRSHNHEMRPYKLGKNQIEHRKVNNDNYLEMLDKEWPIPRDELDDNA
ncbi:hypothetical protein LT85_3396 [Collimonas arenae]|uniref:Uncharacterized protein n=1 Tax=Collimonas arenae TaxID=279058 RepID=A0A0A1FFV0_9BURK|nr:hypothetical protein [Collimonas arenae]AIY42554.1 hypothetical protein LT85_3396 [Collimonas arenae]